jgi:hypothetical protein
MLRCLIFSKSGLSCSVSGTESDHYGSSVVEIFHRIKKEKSENLPIASVHLNQSYPFRAVQLNSTRAQIINFFTSELTNNLSDFTVRNAKFITPQ